VPDDPDAQEGAGAAQVPDAETDARSEEPSLVDQFLNWIFGSDDEDSGGDDGGYGSNRFKLPRPRDVDLSSEGEEALDKLRKIHQRYDEDEVPKRLMAAWTKLQGITGNPVQAVYWGITEALLPGVEDLEPIFVSAGAKQAHDVVQLHLSLNNPHGVERRYFEMLGAYYRGVVRGGRFGW
jgi:hypothetical protein